MGFRQAKNENPITLGEFLDISVPASGWTSRKDNRARFQQISERYGFGATEFNEGGPTDQQLEALGKRLQNFADCDPLIDAYHGLTKVGADLPQIYFADVKQIPIVHTEFLEFLASLEIRNPRVLIVGGQISNSQVFTGLSVPSSPAELATPNEDYLASTFGLLFDYANAIARSREELLLGGAAASAYGVSFNLPISPFCLFAPIVAALFFLGISVSVRQRNEYRALAATTLRSLDPNLDDYESAGYRSGKIGLLVSHVAENAVFAGFAIVYLGLMAILVFASYEITNKGWAFRWLTTNFDGWWVFYPWAILLALIHLACLPIMLARPKEQPKSTV